jgi:hypothetical protein
LTPQALLAERVKDLQAYALKCDGRHRKVRLFPSPRVFPPTGLSVKDYVTAYYALNQLGTVLRPSKSKVERAANAPGFLRGLRKKFPDLMWDTSAKE